MAEVLRESRTDVLVSYLPVGLQAATEFYQAERIAERLARQAVAEVHASPLERTLETARPIAARCGAPLKAVDALTALLIRTSSSAWPAMA